MKKRELDEKKIDAAKREIACAQCKHHTAFTKVDLTKPAERCTFWNGSSKEAQWNMLRPMKERDGTELCYVCDKIHRKLMAV